MSKSLVSPDFAEFAKRWVGSNIDLTPIGAGLILQSMRSSVYVGTLFLELVAHGLLDLRSALSLLESRPSFIRGNSSSILWLALFTGLVNEWHHIDVKTMIWKQSFVTAIPPVESRKLLSVYSDKVFESLQARGQETERAFVYFIKNWWRNKWTTLESHSVLNAIVLVMSPGFWLYFSSYLKGFDDQYWSDLQKAWEVKTFIEEATFADLYMKLTPMLLKIRSIEDRSNILSIDWSDMGDKRGSLDAVLAPLSSKRLCDIIVKTSVEDGSRSKALWIINGNFTTLGNS